MKDPFKWEPQFETRLPDVDEQHQYLLKLINGVGAKFSENKLRDDDSKEIFQELAQYAQYHFQTEERLMLKVGVADRSEDMAGYESLIKRADEAVYAAKHSGKNCVKSVDDIL